jgi:hypothetical protein
LSPQDTEIQRRCESVLNSAVTFKELRDSRGLLLDVYFAWFLVILSCFNLWEKKGNLNSMKGILSYYHTTISNKRALNDAEYMYAAALVSTHYPPLPK